MRWFTIEEVEAADTDEGEVRTGRLVWHGDDEPSVDEVLRTASEPASERSDVDEASGSLRDYLSLHPVALGEVINAEAKDYGHKEHTIKRARRDISAGGRYRVPAGARASPADSELERPLGE